MTGCSARNGHAAFSGRRVITGSARGARSNGREMTTIARNQRAPSSFARQASRTMRQVTALSAQRDPAAFRSRRFFCPPRTPQSRVGDRRMGAPVRKRDARSNGVSIYGRGIKINGARGHRARQRRAAVISGNGAASARVNRWA